MAEWVAFLTADSALRLPPGERVAIVSPPESGPRVTVQISSEYLPPPADAVPRGLLIEVRGASAQPVEKVVDWFLGIGGEFSPLLTLIGNAFIGDPDLLVAYDVSAGLSAREWIQQYRGQPAVNPPNSRPISVAELGPALDAANKAPQRDRWGRAVANYREALRHWKPGDELMAVEHLQIAGETLTPISIARVVSESGKTETELADQWGFDARQERVGTFMSRQVSLEETYRGDDQLRRDVRDASNGFEHGFMTFAEARALAERARDQAARLIRAAILREAVLGATEVTALTRGPFEIPLALAPTRHLWRGNIEVDDEQALEPAQPPLLLKNWDLKIISSEETEHGEIRMQTEHSSGGPPDGAKVTPKKKVTIMPVGLGEGAVPPRITTDQITVDEQESG